MSDYETPLEKRAEILGELWMNYKNSEGFEDFMKYNDLGLPLAWAVNHEVVDMNDMVQSYVNETWDVFLEALDVEDTGFESLNALFEYSGREVQA